MARRVLLGAALIAFMQAMAVAPLPAHEAAQPPIQTCIDGDGDEAERNEIAALRSWRFDRLDQDDDGAITRDEFVAGAEHRLLGWEGFWQRAALWAWMLSGCAFGRTR
jgi:hypothetical protein